MGIGNRHVITRRRYRVLAVTIQGPALIGTQIASLL
jgi:hypothetical protein